MSEKFSVFNLGSLQTNSILIQNDGHSVIIDPAGNVDFWIKVLDSKNLILDAIYLTHGHFDHIEALADLLNQYNVPWFIHPADLPLLFANNDYLNYNNMPEIKMPEVNSVPLISGEHQFLKGINALILHTPGHTLGSCCFWFQSENVLVSGDTLFADTIGRTDLPFSNPDDMEKSISLLKGENFSDALNVIPGHGEIANITYIKENNPFFN